MMDNLSATDRPLLLGPGRHREKPLEFSDLPTEIRFEIWKLATPKSRILRVKVKTEFSSASLLGPFSPVPTILHVCQESRHFGLTMFRHGFQDISDGLNDFYWNPSIDTVYIVPFHKEMASPYSTTLELSARMIPYHTIPLETFPDVQHLAFPLSRSIFPLISTTESPFLNWLTTLPSLQTICFLLEPMGNWLGDLDWFNRYLPYPTAGDYSPKISCPPSAIVLYEPVETHVYGYSSPNMLPSKIETKILGVVDEIWKSTHLTTSPPAIEVLVMGAKKFKNSGFCLPCPRNL